MKLIKLLSLLIFFLFSSFYSPLTHAAPTTPTPTPSTCTSNSDCVSNPNLTGCFYASGGGHFCKFAQGPSPASSSHECTINGKPGVNTALGCISTDIENGGFINTFLSLAIGLGGTIALLLILFGVFIITTSAGIPDKLNQGKELITSAISGLLFIVLSVVLLNLIGIKILSIPGF